jgi:hypothetical protein
MSTGKLNHGEPSHKMPEVVGVGMLTACGEVPDRSLLGEVPGITGLEQHLRWAKQISCKYTGEASITLHTDMPQRGIVRYLEMKPLPTVSAPV